MSQILPKLRNNLDLRRVQSAEGDFILISCQQGLLKNPIRVASAVAPLLTCLNGVTSFEKVLEDYSGYEWFNAGLLEDMVKFFDSNYLLETDNYYKIEKKDRERFNRSGSRKAAFAGLSYPDDTQELKALVDAYLEDNRLADKPEGKLNLLVSPHIDYRRGGHSYGTAYNLLKGQRNDIYIVMGTAHKYSEHLFHLTKKHFESPNGTALTEIEFVDQLSELYGPRSFADEILHKQEHSLELQIPFLKEATISGRIIPVLVGSFHRMIMENKYPEEYEIYDKFVASFCAVLRRYLSTGIKVCFIAGVDMAHMGTYFGDEEALSQESIELIRERDQQYLQCIINRDKHALFNHLKEDQDARKICGYPTLYTILDIFDRLGIQINSSSFKYDMAIDEASDCCVSFAAGGLWG